MKNVLLQVAPEPDIWLELAKAGLPALILGIGCAALWRAWAVERAEVKRVNEARITDLQEMMKLRD